MVTTSPTSLAIRTVRSIKTGASVNTVLVRLILALAILLIALQGAKAQAAHAQRAAYAASVATAHVQPATLIALASISQQRTIAITTARKAFFSAITPPVCAIYPYGAGTITVCN